MGKLSTPSKLLSKVSLIAFLGASSVSFASGFAIKEQAVTGLGTAYSGTAAFANDASGGFYNSASMINMDGTNLAVSAIGIFGDAEFEISSATNNVGAALTPNNDEPKGDAYVPGFHFTKKLNDKLAVGLYLVTPFGLKTEYDEDTATSRYLGTLSSLVTMNYGASVAYEFMDGWSVGVGADILHAKAKLYQKINGVTNVEGVANNYGSGWGAGWHAGLFYKMSDSTRMGLAYKSDITVNAKGYRDSGASQIGHAVFDTKVNLPDSIVYSIYQDFDDKWALLGDFEWVNWSKFYNLRLDYRSNTFINSIYDYKDTWRLALGIHYNHDDNWMFKFGLAHEKSPTDDRSRTVRIPDADRNWLSLGARYAHSKNLAIDVGYTHLFFKNGHIDDESPDSTLKQLNNGALARQTVVGTYKANANIVGVQLTWNFV